MADIKQPLAEVFGHLITDQTDSAPSPGTVEDFIKLLQEKLDEQIETPPTTQPIERLF